MNFIQTEMTWPQGMKGLQNGMVQIAVSRSSILADQGEKLSLKSCGSRRGMERMTSGMVAHVCKKGSSI